MVATIARPPRRVRRALHGVLLVDKPVGWTSQDAVAKVRGILGATKAGHAGTLDPLADGLLPVALGAATKFVHGGLDAAKSYRAVLRLGERTTTGDREGDVVERRPVPALDAETVAVALAGLVGETEQVPPMHSAVKVGGRPLYAYARRGIEVERASRRVTIARLECVAIEPEAHRLTVDVTCSKGTYVRVLAESIGERLGCGAHLHALRRTAVGALSSDGAIAPSALEALDDSARLARLLAPDALLATLAAVTLDASEAARFLCGLRRRGAWPDAPAVRVLGPAPAAGGAPAFLGTARVVAGELIPERLMSPAEVAAVAGVDALSVPTPAMSDASMRAVCAFGPPSP